MDRITAAQVFVATAERGSLTAAALQLGMSRAMATRYLAQMERWAGVRLLHRSTRSLGPTPAGEALLVHCRALLDAASWVPQASVEDDGPGLQGLLRIACSASLAEHWLAAVVADFLQQHPRMAVDLVLANQAAHLVDERIDLAIRITNTPGEQLIARPLARCRSVACAAPAYLARHGTPVRVEDLALHNCLNYTHFGRSLWHFSQDGAPASVAVAGNLGADDAGALLGAALAGAGITLQPAYAVAAHLAAGRLVALLPGAEPVPLGVYGLYASRRHMPAALRRMLDLLAERFAADPGWARYAGAFPTPSDEAP